MKQIHRFFAAFAALTIGVAAAVESNAITDAATAIRVATRYTKVGCNAVTPCTYKAQREASNGVSRSN